MAARDNTKYQVFKPFNPVALGYEFKFECNASASNIPSNPDLRNNQATVGKYNGNTVKLKFGQVEFASCKNNYAVSVVFDNHQYGNKKSAKLSSIKITEREPQTCSAHAA